jgi:uncharacterized membrane protein YfbV (UPF0208 family)
MSITLTTGKLVQVNGVTLENNTTGADMSFDIDFFANVATFTLRTGVLQSGNLNPGVYGDTVTVSLNMVTGAYQSSNGVSGTISGTQLQQFQTMMKNLRNGNEVFVAATPIMAGIQVPW